MKKTLAIMLALIMVVCLVPTVAFADGAAIYVSSSGYDTNNGTEASPYATLAKAVDAAPSGATIYVMSDLTMTESARFWDKHLTITSGEGDPYTITRGIIDTVSDKARGSYNPAMIEVQTSDSSASLTLTNIILDDNRNHAGTVFAQAISGEGHGDNTIYVQDAIVASNATEDCTITLGEGAVLRNFGGMSAVRVTNKAKLVMKSGSVIEDTDSHVTRTKGTETGEVGPAGAVWIQSAAFEMEDGAKIQNVDGRAVYADGGEATIGGTISGITGNSNMWQGTNGSAIHLRNSAKGTLTGTCVIENVSGGGSAVSVGGGSFEMQNGSIIKSLTGTTGVYTTDSNDVAINGEITELIDGNAVNLNSTNAVLGADCNIHHNACATALVYLRDGSDLKIKGKINENTSTGNCAVLFIVTNGESSHATLEDGGEICNNVNGGSKYGAAVEIQQGKCSFTMNGGKITGNKGPLGAVQVHKDTAKFVMNGGEITGNTTTGTIDAGVYLSESASPTAELNGGVLQSVVVGNKVNSKTENGHVFIKNGFNLVADHVNMLEGPKTITPADDSFNIKLGNASTDSVTALTEASTAKGWSDDPLATFWTQRDNAATMTVGGLTINPNNPIVYALMYKTDEAGNHTGELVVCTTTVEGDKVTLTVPGSAKGFAVALVQPTGDFGNVVITGPEEIKEGPSPSATTYEIPYTATYTMSRSFKTMLAQLNLNPDGATSAINLQFVVELDNRLTAKKDEAIDKFIYTFDGAGVLEPIDNEIVVSDDGHTITVPCTLKNGWRKAIEADEIKMTLDGTGVLQANFTPGGVLGTTGNIQAILPIQGGIINVLIPANVCKTNMVGSDPTPPPSADPSPTPGGGNGGGGGYYHPTTTPVPVVVIPPKTGDMTVWQSILHFFGIR